MEKIIERLKKQESKEEIILFSPAIECNLSEFEAVHKVSLPDDIKTFYRFCNGFEGGEWVFRIIPLEEIEKGKAESVGEYFVIAEYLYYCVTWGIKFESDHSYKIFSSYYNIDTGKMQINNLWNSLAEFIEDYLEQGIDGVEKKEI